MLQGENPQGNDAVPSVEMRNVTKIFGNIVANSNVSFKAFPGQIHALVGENGAGKSTAIKMLYGLYTPTSGDIFINGKKKVWSSPAEAIRASIGMVHQHFMLAAPHTVLENFLVLDAPVRFGQEKNKDTHQHQDSLGYAFNSIDKKKAKLKLTALAKKLNYDIDWDEKIEALPVGLQQRIEILKLLYMNAEVLILDEPTAVLTPQEIDELFVTLRKLKNEGKTIIIITHKLKEVLGNADTITILRRGESVGHLRAENTTQQELADLMVGRKVQLTSDDNLRIDLSKKYPRPQTAPLLNLKKLSVSSPEKMHLDNIDLKVYPGEIVGVAGIEGNGQSQLIHSILFPHEWILGQNSEMSLLGHDLRKLSGSEIRKLLALIPEDRLKEGLLLEGTLEENYLLGGLLGRRELKAQIKEAFQEFDVRPSDPKILARSLSGGNQQKLILAREFHRKNQFLICAQPTRGVDVGAIEFIHERIIKARNHGVGVLLITSELEEVMSLSDRIVVMFGGKILAQFQRGEWNESVLGLAMGGGGVSTGTGIRSDKVQGQLQ
jgi:ABC-type uncharacterized transport system ATPase subunit